MTGSRVVCMTTCLLVAGSATACCGPSDRETGADDPALDPVTSRET